MASKPRNRTRGNSPKNQVLKLSAYSHGSKVFGALTIAAALVFLVPLTGSISLWGLTYPHYSIGIDYYVLAGLAILTALFALRPAKKDTATGRNNPLLYWGFAACIIPAVGLAIYFYPVAFAFLGDGAIYLGEVFRIVIQPGYESSLTKITTYLSGYAITQIASQLRLNDSNAPFIIASAASYLILFGGMFFLLRRERLIIVALWIILLLGSGGMLFFFGYVELYALGFAFAGLFLAASWAVFRNNLHAAVPGVFLVLAIASTASNALIIPAYLVLLHWKLRGTGGKPSLHASAVILALFPLAALVVLYAIFGAGIDNPYLMPIQATNHTANGITFGKQSYTLFSTVHLLDALNVLFLVCGAALPLLLIPAFAAKPVKWLSPLVLFAIVACSGGLALVLAGNTTFGMARDWDIMAAAGLAVILLLTTVIVQLWEAGEIPLARFLPLLFVIAVTPSYFWVKVNAESGPSAERFTDLVAYYDGHVSPAYTFNALENLRKHYFSEGMTEQYVQTLLQMGDTRYELLETFRELIGALKNPQAAPIASAGFSAMFNTLSAAAEERVPETDYRYLPAKTLRQFAVHALLSTKEAGYPELTDAYIPKFREAFGEWPEFVIYDAYAYTRSEPAKRFETIQPLDMASLTDIALIIRAGNIARDALQFREAVQMYERALEMDPHQYQNVYISLAEVYYRGFRNKEKSVETLEACIKNCIGSKAAAEAQEILARINQ